MMMVLTPIYRNILKKMLKHTHSLMICPMVAGEMKKHLCCLKIIKMFANVLLII